MKTAAPVILTLLCAGPAFAQTVLKYEATIGPDGKVVVAPSDESAGTMVDQLTVADQLYILKDAEGAVKAIYPSQTAAMEQLSPGETVEALATAGMNNGGSENASASGNTSIESSAIRQAAEKVAQDMLEQTRSVMCGMKARPTSFTTGAEISFHLFAGTTLQVSATWESDTVCS